MATTVNAAFETLHSWLTTTSDETATAASHRRSIETRLKDYMGMTKFFRSGSFGHGTNISGISDVDYMAVFPGSQLPNDSNAALQKVKVQLETRFPNTGVHIRNPAVIVPFGNTISEKHEITPAYYIEDQLGYPVYGISNRGSGWMKTSPSAHNAYINRVNDGLSKKVKPLIRFIKLWNHMREGGIRSFYLEMRVAEYADTETSIVYSVDVLRALKHLRSKQLAAMQDPLGICGYIHPSTDAVKASALSRLDTAIGRAERACAREGEGKHREAIAEWNLVFSNYFPDFG